MTLRKRREVPAEQRLGSPTIVDVRPATPRKLSALLYRKDPPQFTDRPFRQQLFKIRLADVEGRRSSASMLIKKMYSWRGYQAAVSAQALAGETPTRMTLVAVVDEVTVGTITIGFDSPLGLLVDELYRNEANELRAHGRRVCEFTKLAVDRSVRSKQVLASLFHIAYIYAAAIHRFSDILIEVNPRHVKFYQDMLGFRQLAGERLNTRVNAPAVLLALDLDYARERLARFGGRVDLGASEKSFYPYAFSPAEEAGIASRLQALAPLAMSGRRPGAAA